MNLRRTTIVRTLLVCFIIGASGGALLAQKVIYQVHPETGAIRHLAVQNDTRNMNWMQETDGSQYKWIKEEYGWGLGGFSIVSKQVSFK